MIKAFNDFVAKHEFQEIYTSGGGTPGLTNRKIQFSAIWTEF